MIELHKFEKSDYNRLIDWIISEESMIQFSGPMFKYPISGDQLDNYIKPSNRMIFKVIISETQEVIGHAELNNVDPKNKSARICRVLIGDPKNRNKGYGQLVIKELVRIGFNELDLHRIDLGVFDFNHQAIECYKACGFEIEGHFRETYRVGNNYWSTYNMSILNKSL